MKTQIEFIKNLGYNWDGYMACKVPSKVIENTIMIIKNLPKKFFDLLDYEEIIPSPYGTINIEWNNEADDCDNDDYVSFEIGLDGCTMISQLPNDEPIDIDQKELSEESFTIFHNTLDKLYEDVS